MAKHGEREGESVLWTDCFAFGFIERQKKTDARWWAIPSRSQTNRKRGSTASLSALIR